MRKERILVVDDSEATAEMLIHALTMLGYDPLAMAAQGSEAIRLAQQLRPDLVLMDVNLEEPYDGIRAAEELNERLGIRSLLITGLEVAEVLPRAHRASPVGYLHKPFNAAQLQSSVAMAVHLRDVQAQLQSSRETLAAMLHAADDGLLVADRTGHILEANEAACRHTGLTHTSLVSLSLEELLSRHTPPATVADFRARIGEVQPAFTCRWHTADHRDIELGVRSENGTTAALRLLCTLSDVSDRLRTAESVRLLSRAVEQSPVSIVITDTAGAIQYVNPRFCAVTGFTADEVVGQNPRILKSGRQPPEFYADLWTTISDGRDWQGEFQNRRKNGEVFWERASISPVRDASGRITHFVGIKEDITSEKATARALELRQSYLAAIIENQPGPVWLKDNDGHVLAANRAFAELCGAQKAADVVGRTLAEISSPLHEVLSRTDLLVGEGSSKRFCIPWPVWGDAQRWFEIYKSIARDSANRQIGVVGSARDVTSERQAEVELLAAAERLKNANEKLTAALNRERDLAHEANAANRAKSAFLASMSHELRTPLNVINGLSASLVRDTSDPQAAHSAGLILECGQHLLGIIQEILDYSVLQAGRTRLEPKPHVLADLISPVLRQVAVTTREKSLELSYWLPPHLPATIVTDGRRLQQILLNLLQNATKFTDHGGIHLNVAAGPRPNGEWQWTFAVFDSGAGIGAEGLKRIFTPFSQGTDPARYGGTGLGLAISKSFARLMGGDVRARSLLGRGSCFRCTVRTPAPDAHAGQVADLAPMALHGVAITLVSRPTRTARLLAATLRSWGLQPTLLRGAAWQASASTSPAPAIIEIGEVDPANVGPRPVIWLERADGGRAEPASPNQLALPVALPELRDALQHLLAPMVDTPAASAPAAASPRPAPDVRLAQRIPLRILAADDIRTNREALRIILRLFGYEITVVNDGIDVLRTLDQHSYDLVLLDVQMPGMDGLAAARQIVNRQPDPAKRPKLVAITAGALPGDRAACLSAGMDDYLAKPVLPDAIEQCILRHFAEQSSLPPPPPPGPNRPLVDAAHLEAALPHSLGPARIQILRGMRNAAALDYTTLRVDLERACADRNGPVLARTLHALKGCFLTVGWARLAHFCADRLAEVRSDTFTGWTTLADQLRELYAESQDAMQHHVGDPALGSGPNAQPSLP